MYTLWWGKGGHRDTCTGQGQKVEGTSEHLPGTTSLPSPTSSCQLSAVLGSGTGLLWYYAAWLTAPALSCPCQLSWATAQGGSGEEAPCHSLPPPLPSYTCLGLGGLGMGLCGGAPHFPIPTLCSYPVQLSQEQAEARAESCAGLIVELCIARGSLQAQASTAGGGGGYTAGGLLSLPIPPQLPLCDFQSWSCQLYDSPEVGPAQCSARVEECS